MGHLEITGGSTNKWVRCVAQGGGVGVGGWAHCARGSKLFPMPWLQHDYFKMLGL